MTLKFTRMVPKKSYEHVVEQIEDAIFDGKIQAGERLPSELKLKDSFNTSRGTIREALRVLENKGLVSIRPGVKGGAEVQPANTRAMQNSVATMIRQQQCSLEHLAEFRANIEGFAAFKAASKATQEQITQLNKILDDISNLMDSKPDNWQAFHLLDAKFHQHIAKMADNPLVMANQACIHENIHVYFHAFLPFSTSLLQEDVNDLKIIARAISLGNAEAAQQAAQAHVKKFSKLMETHRK